MSAVIFKQVLIRSQAYLYSVNCHGRFVIRQFPEQVVLGDGTRSKLAALPQSSPSRCRLLSGLPGIRESLSHFNHKHALLT